MSGDRPSPGPGGGWSGDVRGLLTSRPTGGVGSAPLGLAAASDGAPSLLLAPGTGAATPLAVGLQVIWALASAGGEPAAASSPTHDRWAGPLGTNAGCLEELPAGPARWEATGPAGWSATGPGGFHGHLGSRCSWPAPGPGNCSFPSMLQQLSADRPSPSGWPVELNNDAERSGLSRPAASWPGLRPAICWISPPGPRVGPGGAQESRAAMLRTALGKAGGQAPGGPGGAGGSNWPHCCP